MSTTISQSTFTLTIKSPDSIVFEGEVDAITSVNEKGRFDVLPYHENFISLVREFVIIHQKDIPQKEIPIQGGVLKVKENHAHIFLGIQPEK